MEKSSTHVHFRGRIIMLCLDNEKQKDINTFKGICARHICDVYFLNLHESNCQTRENVFYFTSKTLFVLEKTKF